VTERSSSSAHREGAARAQQQLARTVLPQQLEVDADTSPVRDNVAPIAIKATRFSK
jgi:hypothetical protein